MTLLELSRNPFWRILRLAFYWGVGVNNTLLHNSAEEGVWRIGAGVVLLVLAIVESVLLVRDFQKRRHVAQSRQTK